VAFVVTGQPCSSTTFKSAMAIYQVNGRTIKAFWTHSDTTAWLCLKTHRGRPLLVLGANGPPRIDALVVAYAEPAD